MNYALPTSKVVAGLPLAYVSYGFVTDAMHHSWFWFVSGGAVFAFGLGLAVHGLFTGIEAAVEAGRERPVDEQTTE